MKTPTFKINRKLLRQSLTSATAAAGTAVVAWKVTTLTSVIAGPTAVAGAIKTTTILTSGGPVVLSLVKASLFSKIVCALSGIILVGLTTIWVHEQLKNLDLKKEINSIQKGINSLKS